MGRAIAAGEPRIVAIGGGTGLATLLRGLKSHSRNITAIVTVSDDGGSSGRLRGEMGILPPGDIRNCLVALADVEPLMAQLFQYRFQRGALAGHSFGNLFIGAMTDILGDFERAVQESSRVLAVRGRVLPATLQQVEICARVKDGRVICGESAISSQRGRIQEVFLRPEAIRGLPEAVGAIQSADLIVMGPGSLYTSILPNLLIDDLQVAVRESQAVRVFVVNVMTQPGETDGYTALAHMEAFQRHLGPGLADAVVVNTGRASGALLERYRSEGAEPVDPSVLRLRAMGLQVVAADLISQEDLVRHKPELLAETILGLVPHRPARLGKFSNAESRE